MIELIAPLIPIAAWYRFKDTPTDRDYTPYAYPAVMGTGYLKDGHADIKPPLIHWSYKCWWTITSLMPFSQTARLRLLPALGMSLAVSLVSASKPEAGLILALLFASPSLWGHMANTEWLTVMLWSLAASLPGPWSWVMLGLTPWANQKNVLLIAPVAWALGLSLSPITPLALLGPSVAILAYLSMTGRLTSFIDWAWTKPKAFGRARTLKVNTLSAQHLLRPGLILMLPLLAACSSPWAWVFLAVLGVAVASKQVVPHHYLAAAFPLAMGFQSWEAWPLVAFGVAFCLTDVLPWLKPELIYPVTFRYRDGRNYGDVLADGREVEDWILANTKVDETIWVNGWENQIYLNTGRKAWRVQVPEEASIPEGEAPRVIVHCANGNLPFDYDGYEHEFMSVGGFYNVMRRA